MIDQERTYLHLVAYAQELGAGSIFGRLLEELDHSRADLGLAEDRAREIEAELQTRYSASAIGAGRPGSPTFGGWLLWWQPSPIRTRVEYCRVERDRRRRWRKMSGKVRFRAGETVLLRWTWRNTGHTPVPGDQLILRGSLLGGALDGGACRLTLGERGASVQMDAASVRRFFTEGLPLGEATGHGGRLAELPAGTVLYAVARVRVTP